MTARGRCSGTSRETGESQRRAAITKSGRTTDAGRAGRMSVGPGHRNHPPKLPVLETSKLTERDKRVGETGLGRAVELESSRDSTPPLRNCQASVGRSRDELESTNWFAIGWARGHRGRAERPSPGRCSIEVEPENNKVCRRDASDIGLAAGMRHKTVKTQRGK